MASYLVVGGTGMLQAAVLGWNEEGHEAMVIARTKESLLKLSKAAANPDRIQLIQTDYHQLASFQQQLESLPAPDVIVSWMHKSGNDAMQAMCGLYGSMQKQISLFHIKGSSAADPSHNFIPVYAENIVYHEIILGFKIMNNTSRWLTNEEIADGVREAVEQRQQRFIVGTVRPWRSRP